MSNRINEYLLPSRSVEIEAEGLQVPLRTLIESEVKDGEFRVLAPMLDGKTYLFSGITTVNLIYSYQEADNLKISQVLCSIVKKGMIDSLPVITLRIIGEPKPTQRRRAFRVNVFSKIVGQTADGQIHDMTTKDISVYGMFIYANERMERGKTMRILWNFEGSESRLEDPAFLEEAFSGEEHEDVETVEASLDRLLEKNSEELRKKSEKENKPPKKDYFVIDAHIVSCDYDSEMGKFAVRLNYDQIVEEHSKRILRFLYKKQSEILSNDPHIADRIDKFFSQVPAEEPLPFYVPLLSLFGYAFCILAVVFLLLATPQQSTFLDDFFNVSRSVTRKLLELRLSLASSILSVAFGSVYLGVRISLSKRKINKMSIWNVIGPVLFCLVLFYILKVY